MIKLWHTSATLAYIFTAFWKSLSTTTPATSHWPPTVATNSPSTPPRPAPRLPCVTEGHTKLPAVVEGSRQRVPIRPGHGHASVRMRGPIRKQCKRQRKRMGRKSPPCHFLALCRLTFDPCPVASSWLPGSAWGQAAWDLLPVCLCGCQSLEQEVKVLMTSFWSKYNSACFVLELRRNCCVHFIASHN